MNVSYPAPELNAVICLTRCLYICLIISIVVVWLAADVNITLDTCIMELVAFRSTLNILSRAYGIVYTDLCIYVYVYMNYIT